MSFDEPPEQGSSSSLADKVPGGNLAGSVVQQRNRFIDEFVKDFSAWDWLYLRMKMRNVEIDRNEVAGLEDLPTDVIPMIAAHLTASEAMGCKFVCRGWRDAWSDPVVTRCLLQQHYPGALQCLDESSSPEKLLDDLMNRYSRPTGTDWAVNRIPWNIGMDCEAEPGRTGIVAQAPQSRCGFWPCGMRYASGKVAWAVTRSAIVIDDLAAGTWHRVSFLSNHMQGFSTDLVGFSGDLLVVGREDGEHNVDGFAGSSRRLIIHHVASGVQRPINLPNNLIQCFCHRESVIFLTHNNGAYLYRWGGALKQLETSIDETPGVPSSHCQQVYAALFHPSQPETVFLVSIFCAEIDADHPFYTIPARIAGDFDRSKPRYIVVTKYQHGQQTRHQVTPLVHSEAKVRCVAANATGMYYICEWDRYPGGGRHLALALVYNVLTEAFYSLSGLVPSSWWKTRLWNSRLVSHGAASSRKPSSKKVSCLKFTERMMLAKFPAPEILASEFGTSVVTEVGIEEVWDREDCEACTSQAQLDFSLQNALAVDDDFIVIVEHWCGYTVLSHRDHQVRLVERKDNAAVRGSE